MDAENLFAALDVGAWHDHAAVETARAEKRRVENVGAIGGGDEDDAFIAFETVHLDQQGVEGLFALVMPAAE
ncbi:MAG TPA: hypothetical protein VJJ70_08245, partial [Anaerolineales bacterium]|nr:hypothetical protein [Anaerolineales bacterium]